MPLQRVLKFLLLALIAVSSVGCIDNEGFDDFNVRVGDPGQPAALRFLNQPQRAAGQEFGAIQVAVVDSTGQVVTTATNPVTIALANPNGATLSGDLTQIPVNGVATFSGLSVDVPGSYSFIVSSPGLEGATSNTFLITPGSAFSVTFLQGPPPTPAPGSTPADFNASNSVTVGQPFANPISVEVRDEAGNLVTTSVTVQLRIVRDATGNVTVSDNVAVTVNGVATFPDFSIDSGGGAMILAAAVNSSVAAVSDPFIVAGPFSTYATSISRPATPPALFRPDGVPAPANPTYPIVGPITVDGNPPDTTGATQVYGLAALPNGQVVAAIQTLGNPAFLASLDLSNGAATTIGTNLGLPSAFHVVTDLTVNPSTGTVYAYVADNSVSPVVGQIYTVNPTAGTATALGTATSPFNFAALAVDVFNVDGPVLYGVGTNNDGSGFRYVTFDLSTGVATDVAGASADLVGPSGTTGYFACTTLALNPFNPNQLVGVFVVNPMPTPPDTGFVVRFFNKATGATEDTNGPFVPSYAAIFTFP